eukprot:7023337-Prymnesium_polylepis.1
MAIHVTLSTRDDQTPFTALRFFPSRPRLRIPKVAARSEHHVPELYARQRSRAGRVRGKYPTVRQTRLAD